MKKPPFESRSNMKFLYYYTFLIPVLLCCHLSITDGKKCPRCNLRIYHDKWNISPKLAEERWAHKEARQREIDEVVDFLSWHTDTRSVIKSRCTIQIVISYPFLQVRCQWTASDKHFVRPPDILHMSVNVLWSYPFSTTSNLPHMHIVEDWNIEYIDSISNFWMCVSNISLKGAIIDFFCQIGIIKVYIRKPYFFGRVTRIWNSVGVRQRMSCSTLSLKLGKRQLPPVR